MLKVKNLSKSYGSLEVLKGISFEIKEGTIYGFLGPNGAGKTTTMNILAGLIHYQSGKVDFQGKNYRRNSRNLLKGIGYLPQKPAFYPYMSANEYLDFIGRINHLGRKEIHKRTEELLQLVQLKEAAGRKIGGYSGGMKQRLGLSIALFNRPKLLLLDEPTASLDPEGRQEVLEFIRSLRAQGTTVFLSTHILNDVERVCDEVSILNEGSIILSDTLSNLRKDYIQPIFDIEFQERPLEVKEKLQGMEWIEKILIKGHQLSVYVKDIDQAKYRLISMLPQENPILSYTLRKSNLEDIFIRMVKTNGNL